MLDHIRRRSTRAWDREQPRLPAAPRFALQGPRLVSHRVLWRFSRTPNAPLWARSAQHGERTNSDFRCKHVYTLQVIQRLQRPQERFDARSAPGFEIAQGLFRNTRLGGGGALIDIAGKAQSAHPCPERDLQLFWPAERNIHHTGILLPIKPSIK